MKRGRETARRTFQLAGVRAERITFPGVDEKKAQENGWEAFPDQAGAILTTVPWGRPSPLAAQA